MNQSFLVLKLARQPGEAGPRWCYGLGPYSIQMPTPDVVPVPEQIDIVLDELPAGGNADSSSFLMFTGRLEARLRAEFEKLNKAPDPSSVQPCSSFRNILLPTQVISPGKEKPLPYRVFVAFERVAPQELMSLQEAWARYVLFKTLYVVMSALPVDYEYVTAYAAWQQYNLAKFLWEKTPDPRPQALRDELRWAYRILAGLLQSDRYYLAFRVLWVAGRARYDQPPPGEASMAGSTGEINEPLLRERLRCSMFLQPERGAIPPKTEDPYPAPGCFRISPAAENEKATSTLHFRFREPDGQAELRRVIRNELLPRYNVREAFRLAALMASGGEARGIWYHLLRLLPDLLFVLALAGSTAVLLGAVLGSQEVASGSLLVTTALTLGLMALIWRSGGLSFGLTLLLPRVLGSLVLGGFLLFLASDPWRLADWVHKGPRWVWLIEWLVAGLACFVYFSGEAFAAVADRGEAWKRGWWVTCWTVLQALVISTAFAALSKPIYGGILSVPDNPDVSLGGLWVFGVTWHAFPMSGVLTFGPLVIILGNIWQMFFAEEKPVTSSIWLAESR